MKDNKGGSGRPLPVRVALVTGGGRRVGRAIAQGLHAAGYNLAIHYRGSAGEAKSLAAELNAARPRSAAVLRADLLSLPQLKRLASQAQSRWGRLDLLVNNASSYYQSPLAELDEAAFEDLVGTNLRAPLFLTQACAPHLAASGGCVVSILDVHARQAQRPGFSAYTASKAAHWALVESLAVELAPHVRVNGVAPGHIQVPHHNPPTPAELADLADKRRQKRSIPLARLGEAEDVANAVCYLASDAARYLTGAIIPVDGGRRLV